MDTQTKPISLTEEEKKELAIAQERLGRFDAERMGTTLVQFKAWREQRASDPQAPCPAPQLIP